MDMTSPPASPASPASRDSTLAIIAFACVFFCWPVGFILGVIALLQIRKSGGALQGRGFAWAGVAAPFVVVPLLCAAGYPSFQKFQCRAKQSEAKGNLKALYVAEQSYHSEFGRYITNLADLGFTAKGAKIRYEYEVLDATPTSFFAEARATSEMAGDLWSITDANDVTIERNACAVAGATSQDDVDTVPLQRDTIVVCGGAHDEIVRDAEGDLIVVAHARSDDERALAALAAKTIAGDLTNLEPWQPDVAPEAQKVARQISDAVRHAAAVVHDAQKKKARANASFVGVEVDVIHLLHDDGGTKLVSAHVGRSLARYLRSHKVSALTDVHPDRLVGTDADVEVDMATVDAVVADDALLFGTGAAAARLAAAGSTDEGDALASSVLRAGASDEHALAIGFFARSDAAAPLLAEHPAACRVSVRRAR